MAVLIDERIPFLENKHAEILIRAENLRTKFTAAYPIAKIKGLTKEKYVIGKGSTTFCYRLEREMNCLGGILGSNAFKFGVYYGKTKSDKRQIYRYREHWGDNVEDAFVAVKDAIASLLSSAINDNQNAIVANPLSPMFKGKLLHLFYPDQYAPIYSKTHLIHFISELDIQGEFSSEVEMQRALMEYRRSWPALANKPPLLFMELLYDLFDYPQSPDAEGSESTNGASLPLLQQAIKGSSYIDSMPPANSHEPDTHLDNNKPDYDTNSKRRKRIGDRGEDIVFSLEVARLKAAGKKSLSDRVKQVSQETDREGYDILSFDDDGTPRQIEVKATSFPDLANGFYLSANELETSQKLSNYHLYLVFSATSKSPRILRMKKPTFDKNGAPFATKPIVFHITQKTTYSV
jgi:hypothetical protein